MTMEQIDKKTTMLIAKHYGLLPIRIKGTQQIQICKKMNEKRYEVISWDDFERILNEKNLSVYKDASSNFLKIMKKQ